VDEREDLTKKGSYMHTPRRHVTTTITALLLAAGGLGLASAQPVQAVSLLAAPHVQPGPGHARVADLPKADTAHLPVGVHALKGRPPTGAVTAKTASSTTSTASTATYFYSSFAQGPGSGLLAGGATANFSVQSTYLKPTTDAAHSLGEMALIGHNAGGTQVVEGGITTDPTVNGGDLNPHLFVFNWINGVGQCYNGCSWTRTAGSTVTAGMSMTPYLGTVVTLGWQHFPAGSNGQLAGWYAWFQPTGGTGQWFGLFPDSAWTAKGATATPQVDQIQLYGEVAAWKTTPCTDMGNGILPVANQSTAAKISSYTLINANKTAAFDHTNVTDPTHYGLVYLQSTLPSFRYGGPGWNATGTAVGVTGGC
jgi:hypothetical protein